MYNMIPVYKMLTDCFSGVLQIVEVLFDYFSLWHILFALFAIFTVYRFLLVPILGGKVAFNDEKPRDVDLYAPTDWKRIEKKGD